MSIGVNGVRGVPGKLRPIDEGVRGIDPDKLCGGLKSDIGVGGADLIGDPTPSLLKSSSREGESAESLRRGERMESPLSWLELPGVLLLLMLLRFEFAGDTGSTRLVPSTTSPRSSTSPPISGDGGGEDIVSD